MSNNEKFKVAIFLATGYEMGEVIITIDLLRRANIIIDLVSIENDLKIKSSHNVFILCEKKISDIDLLSYKMLILPGGKIGVENLSKNELLKSMLVIFAKDSNKFIAAICAAPQILGQLNLIDNKKITHFPDANIGLNKSIILDEKVVVDNNIITGKSIGAVFEFGLKLIEVLESKEISEQIKKLIVF